ncbi:MAG: helix-turn-helix domain-containing protein [Caulobacteraceae bacterium]
MKLALALIAREAAAQEGCEPADLIVHARSRELTAARQRAWWACRELRPDQSLPQLGRFFHRDHTTILHGLRACRARRARDPVERADGDRLLRAFRPQAEPPLVEFAGGAVGAQIASLFDRAHALRGLFGEAGRG